MDNFSKITIQKPSRLEYIDGLRAVAAIGILLYHAFQFFFISSGRELTWQARIFSTGHLFVVMFVILSGFCLALPHAFRPDAPHRTGPFLAKRAWRILPPYYIVLSSLTLVTLTPMVARALGRRTDGFDVLTHVFLVHNLFPAHIFEISAHLWSVALEMQLYLAVALMLPWLSRPRALLAVTGVISGAWWTYGLVQAIQYPSEIVWVYWYAVPSVLAPCAWAMLAAVRMVQSATVRPNLLAGLGLIALAVGFWLPYRDATGTPWIIGGFVMHKPYGMIAVAIGSILLLRAGRESVLARALAWPPLVWIGQRSFTLYLLHMPLIRLMALLLAKRVPTDALVLVTFASAILVGMLSVLAYPLLEAPFTKLPSRATAQPGTNPA
ncbi:MAG: acyltransferase [Fimbriimonadaceae bacterium]|nr:acyltransferase [Fimbriimonadaceae bacterium]